MTKTQEMYIYLLVAIAMVPALINNVMAVKLFSIAYVLYLVILRRGAVTFPSLVLLASFMSHAYIIYYAIFLISIVSYSQLKRYKVHIYLIALLFFLPLVLYKGIHNMLVFNMGLGPAFLQFQFYFCIFAFFYGVLIVESFDKSVIHALIFVFILVYILHLTRPFFNQPPVIRITFFIIPFLFAGLGYYILMKHFPKTIIQLLLGTALITAAYFVSNSTLTILLASVLTFILFFSYHHLYEKKTFLKLTGFFPFAVSLLILIFGILNMQKYSVADFQHNLKVDSIESLAHRMSGKFFEDRLPIWAGAWYQIQTMNELWLPKWTASTIRQSDKERFVDAGFHSHNLFLELLRTNGYILGAFLCLIFIKMNALGRKVFIVQETDPLFIILTAAALANNIIGSMTGIYVLLMTYAILGMSVMGVAYAFYQKTDDDLLNTI